jgi:hypothetical protein
LRVLAFSFEGKYAENAIYQKLLDLGLLLKEEEEQKFLLSSSSSTTNLEYSPELPSIEEACKLIEVGFEYITEMEGEKLFRKRK